MRNKLKELDGKIRRAQKRLKKLTTKFWVRYGRQPKERTALMGSIQTKGHHD